MDTRFVVTAWRDAAELLELRGDLFAGEGRRRERGVNKVYAWRVRTQELPLLLDSTADIVDAVLQDEGNMLSHNALRLVYATAISRFITGLADTQTELSRDRPAWFPPGQTLQFPTSLRETRHCIVHRHLPSLTELKLAAQESLDWLWEWYWSHLEAAFAAPERKGELSLPELRKRVQGVLKSYVKERKSEIKGKKKETQAARNGLSSYLFIEAAHATKQSILLDLLVDDHAVLPTDKKLGTSMSGAFLIWSPFLLALSDAMPSFLHALLERMIGTIGTYSHGTSGATTESVKEGIYEWLVHILLSNGWQDVHLSPEASERDTEAANRRLLEHTLSLCFTSPTPWTLKLAEKVLTEGDMEGMKSWLKILSVAKTAGQMDVDEGQAEDPVGQLGDNMEVDVETEPPKVSMEVQEVLSKSRGPQKRVGLWRPRPIGMIPKGWEMDE